MWPNLSRYTNLMARINPLRGFNPQRNNTVVAPRKAGPRNGVRIVVPGCRSAAIAEFDSLAEAKAFMERVLKDHPDWQVELILIHD